MSGRKPIKDKKRGHDEMLSSPESGSSSEEMDDAVQSLGNKRTKPKEIDDTSYHQFDPLVAENQTELPDVPREGIEEFSEEIDTKYQEHQPASLVAKIQEQFPDVSAEEIEESIDLVDTFFAALVRTPASTSTPSAETPSDVEMQVEPKSEIPERGLEILEILKQAHLPTLGLPEKWDKTQSEHQLTIFDPKSMQTIPWDKIKGVEVIEKMKKHARSPVGFIMSTRDKNPMPGTQAPAAVRFEHYQRPKLHDKIVKGAQGKELIPCIAHGDYVCVEALQADHMQAKAEILKRQETLIKTLNENSALAEFIMKEPGMEKFFIKASDEKYYGTLFFYELYFNDIDNIWLICQACNLHKSDADTLMWLKEQWLYGPEFLEYLAREKEKEKTHSKGILEKVGNQKGLAQVAIDWFWDRHANYISIQKTLLEEISVPIQILGQKIERVIGEGSIKRAERLNASLALKMRLMAAILEAKIDMRRHGSESEHSSSNEDTYTAGNYTDEGYKHMTDKAGGYLRKTVEEWVSNYAQVEQKDNEEKIEDVQQTKPENIPEGLIYQAIPGDGHCLFHAVGLYVGEDQAFLRRVVALHLEGNLEAFREFIPLPADQTIEDHIRGMRNGTEWVANVEIEILMRVFNRPVVVITSDGNVRNREDLERFSGSPIFVYYNDHNHYDAFLLKEGYTGQAILEQLMYPVEHTPKLV